MDLSKKNLPFTIDVDGRSYVIHTDTQYFINFIRLLKKEELEDISFMFKDKVPKNKEQAILKLIEFTYPQRELPKSSGDTTDDIILDYDKDAELIYSAFMEQYKIDLFETSLHWHKFQALLFGLENTKLNKVMEFRSYVPSKNDSAEYRKQMFKLKDMWKIERELTKAEQKLVDEFDSKIKN